MKPILRPKNNNNIKMVWKNCMTPNIVEWPSKSTIFNFKTILAYELFSLLYVVDIKLSATIVGNINCLRSHLTTTYIQLLHIYKTVDLKTLARAK